MYLILKNCDPTLNPGEQDQNQNLTYYDFGKEFLKHLAHGWNTDELLKTHVHCNQNLHRRGIQNSKEGVDRYPHITHPYFS